MSHVLNCFICEKRLHNGKPLRVIKQRGINSLIDLSKSKGDDKWTRLTNDGELRVHDPCRTSYVFKKTNSDEVNPECEPESESFPFELNCFLCGKPWIPKNKPGRLLCMEKAQKRIEKCIELRSDEWSNEVNRRIEGKNLVQEKARYHSSCIDLFTKPRKNVPSKAPRKTDLDIAFDGLCNYMEECDDCQFTFKELLEKMEGWTTTAIT